MNKLDQILDNLLNLSNKHKISDYVEKFKKNSKIVSDKGLNEIEINKCKVELAKTYYKIGKYVSEKYHLEKKTDYSYDEEYKQLNEKISKLKKYIEKLSESK